MSERYAALDDELVLDLVGKTLDRGSKLGELTAGYWAGQRNGYSGRGPETRRLFGSRAPIGLFRAGCSGETGLQLSVTVCRRCREVLRGT